MIDHDLVRALRVEVADRLNEQRRRDQISGVTPMAAPNLAVPRQFPSMQRVAAGDVVVSEISAAFWDHPGQVLRRQGAR